MRIGREPGWPEIKVGIIAVIALVFMALLVLKIDRSQGLFSRGESIQAHLVDLRGVRLGSPVQFSGVEVGNVNQLKFEKDGSVVLSMSVRSEVRPLVKTSSRLSIESMGVLGDKFILIKPGKPEDPPLRKGEYLQTDLEGGTIFDLVSDTSHTIGQARQAVERFNQIMEKVINSKGTVGKMIDDPTLFDEAKMVFTNLNDLLSKKSTLGKLGSDGSKLYDSISRASNNLDKLLDTANTKQGTIGKFVYDPKLYDNLDKLTEEMALLVKDIRENPKKYFKMSMF